MMAPPTKVAEPIRQPYIEATRATTRVTPICKSAVRTATRQPWAMELRTWFCSNACWDHGQPAKMLPAEPPNCISRCLAVATEKTPWAALDRPGKGIAGQGQVDPAPRPGPIVPA